MRFIVLVKATKDSEAGKMPSRQLLADMGKFNQELIAAGVMIDGGGLHPSSKGARVTFSGKDRTVTKGPFAQTNELVSGYLLDLEAQFARRGRRLGQALPQSDA